MMRTLVNLSGICVIMLSSVTMGVARAAPASSPQQDQIELRTDSFSLSLSGDGRLLHLVDLATNRDYAAPASGPIAIVRRAGQEMAVSRAKAEGVHLTLMFGEGSAEVGLRVSSQPRYLVFEVETVRGERIEELRFINMQSTLKGKLEEPFAVCGLALNLKTNVPELPGPCAAVHASCYPRFGMIGARIAIIGCPTTQLRSVMQEVVRGATDLPHSPLGGPWAMDAPINRGSYLFNFGDLSEEAVDRWIETTKRIGFNQIDFHGGGSFRFGDFRLNPKTYPKGLASLKAVIDKLHAAGISAGLHTYAFFIDKNSEYVTPKPDPRLGKAASFTLASDLSAEATTLPVLESTEKMSTTTGFFVPNSVSLQIEDEMVVFTGVSKSAPFGFTGCQRGAYGTKASQHPARAKVHQLKEMFGLFAPEADSTLFEEVARRTAELFNDAGFDMIYLDALDGEGVIGGYDVGWYYGSKFPFDIARHLKRPALMEMSTFHHHLWYLRSRYVAWDHPNRGYKRFIDVHSQANDEAARMFLPGHQGWWRVYAWSGQQHEPTYADDIEYLCCKCLGRGEGFSLQGIDPTTIAQIPALPRLGEIMRRYEALRHADKVPASIKARLREPGAEFTLDGSGDTWQFKPLHSARHKVSKLDESSLRWTFTNPHGRQPLRARIQMLQSAGAYDEAENIMVADMREPGTFSERGGAASIGVEVQPASEGPSPGTAALSFQATNRGQDRRGAWAKAVRPFAAPLDIASRPALGVWVHGDGRGEVLNVQLRCPPHVVAGIGEHYIPIDFTGWRYVELIELEGDLCGDYAWPYSGNAYGLYREDIDFHQLASIGLWYNNLPAGATADCRIGPIKAIPLASAELTNPSLECNGKRFVLKTSMKTGQYLELDGSGTCHLYGPNGEELPKPAMDGGLPDLEHGENTIRFDCKAAEGARPRVQVTLFTVGDPLRP